MPELSPLVEEVIVKTLAKDPKQRFASLRAFANALEQAYMVSLTPEPVPLPVPMKPIEQTGNQQPLVPVEIGQPPLQIQRPVQRPDRPVSIASPVEPDNVNTSQDVPSSSATTFLQQPKGKTRRQRLFIVVPVALIALLVAGIILVAIGGFINHSDIVANTIVTITPAHPTISDSFAVTAVTGIPNPAAQQVQARVVSYTSPSQSASANATGSITGARASGTLRFINIGPFSIQVSGGILTGGDGVQVSFGTLVVPVGSIDVTGVALNQGTGGILELSTSTALAVATAILLSKIHLASAVGAIPYQTL